MLSGLLTCPPAIEDPTRPTLAGVIDAEALRRHVRQLAEAHWGVRSVSNIQPRILKLQKGKRCTLEIGIETERGPHNLIGKIYSKDRADVFEAMKKIWQSGLGRYAQFSIPEPLAYVPSLRLLLEERVAGKVAKEVFLAGNATQRAEASERCGVWLAHFQTLAPQQGKVRKVRKFLRQSERRVRRIVDAGVPFRNKAEELFQRLLDRSTTLGKSILCAGHGNYSHNQVLLSGRRTVVCDWDGYDRADPCRDAARLIVCLGRLALTQLGSIRKLDRTAETFLRVFLVGKRPGIADHLAFYKAALYLQAAKREVVSRAPRHFERVEILLDEGLRALAG